MAVGDGAVRVRPAPVSPPRLGLLASAARPTMDPGWTNGILFATEACVGFDDVPGGYWWSNCAPTIPEDVPGKSPQVKGEGSRPSYHTWTPYGIVEADTCSADGWTSEDYQGRAQRTLIANESRKLELELWTGRVNAAMGADNDWLANPDTTDDLGIVPLAYALGEAVQYLSENTTGRGMIHAQPRVVSAWFSAQLLRREGNVIYENTGDHVVVPGTGYTGRGLDTGPGAPESGTAADSTVSTIYATDQVYVAQDDVFSFGGSFAENLNRAQNLITWRAERIELAWFGGCAHASIEVDLASPCG